MVTDSVEPVMGRSFGAGSESRTRRNGDRPSGTGKGNQESHRGWSEADRNGDRLRGAGEGPCEREYSSVATAL
jgi:hypothetical protein